MLSGKPSVSKLTRMHFHAIDPVQTMCLRKTEEFWQMKTESIVSEKKTTVTSTRHAVRSVAFGCVLNVSVFVKKAFDDCYRPCKDFRRSMPTQFQCAAAFGGIGCRCI